MSLNKPPPRPTGSDAEAVWFQWVHDHITSYGKVIGSPGIRFEYTTKGVRAVLSNNGPGTVLYVRVCKRDGTEKYIPFRVVGEEIDEADIPEGAAIYDPTA